MLERPHKEEPVTYFGQTDSRGRRLPFGIKAKDRSRHMYVIGKTGMGKSTLLENMAIQDIRNGHGLCFVDPHGKTADLLLDYVPEHRVKDVLYFAPFDMDYPISFNIMEDVGADRRHLVVNGLMATFEKIWVDAWSARMAYILQNTLLALLEYPGSTLLGVNRMLVDKEYRRLVVGNVSDPSVKSFWVDEFAKYTDRYTQEATPAIQNKVGQFTANPLIRNIVGQPQSTFNIRELMDERKIIIVNLSKGKVGEGNANLLGSMFITKVYLAAMSRADVPDTELQKLPNFFLFVDEFQSFANKSFADILSEARKYKLNLTLAHQYIEQMEEEVRAAVFGNVGTMAVFRVGAYDAEFLEKEFAPAITAEDLVNLGIYQIYLKLMIDGVTSPPFSAVTLPPIPQEPQSFRERVIAYSRESFARPRSVVENAIKEWHAPIPPPPKERKEHERPKELQRDSLPAPSHQRENRAEMTRPRFVPQSVQSADAPERHNKERAHPRAAAVPPETPSPLSLAHLRRGGRKGGAEEAHLSELRKALSEVLKNPPAQPEGDTAKELLPSAGAKSEAQARGGGEKEHMQTQRESAGTAPEYSRAGKAEEKHSDEIPEELLRKILDVPRPDAKGNLAEKRPPSPPA